MMLGALLLSAIATAPELQVTVRAGHAAAASCVVRDAEGKARESHLGRVGDAWRWQRGPGETLACAHPGFEPLEIDAAAPGLPMRIERALWPARTLTLLADGPPLEAVVEWRALGSGATTRVARQRLRLEARLELPVACADRLLRVYPEGRAPLSLFVPAGASPLTLKLPAPGAGGELLGRLPAHAILPVEVELGREGGAVQTLTPDAQRIFQAPALAPGRYTLTPRYQGGLRGPTQAVTVRAGETTELVPWALPAAGALSLSAAPDVCVAQNLPARLWLQRVGPQGTVEPRPLADIGAPPCEREVEGLDEGTYEASFRGRGGREALGAARFTVRAGERARVRLGAAQVQLSGRLSWGGEQPAAGFTLVFENDGQTWQASSDEEGQYQAALGPAGEYRITVAARGDSAEASFHRRFHAGEQAADFALDVGAIVVRVVREDAAPLQEDVHLALISKGARRSGAWRPDPQREKRFSGLPAGEYWVTARTASGLVALSPGRALLTAEQPQAEVELALGRHDGVLEVVDESGGPLPAAQVEARETLLAPAGPGTFSLREVPMGDWLKVRAPGYLPACRIVQPGDLPAMRVPLRRAAEAVTLSLAPELGWDSGLWQMPGSDCPVAMSELEYEARPERSGTTVVVRLPRGRYQLAVGALTQAVEAPGGEVHFGAPR